MSFPLCHRRLIKGKVATWKTFEPQPPGSCRAGAPTRLGGLRDRIGPHPPQVERHLGKWRLLLPRLFPPVKLSEVVKGSEWAHWRCSIKFYSVVESFSAPEKQPDSDSTRRDHRRFAIEGGGLWSNRLQSSGLEQTWESSCSVYVWFLCSDMCFVCFFPLSQLRRGEQS